jgi:hypothetical protein
MEVLIDAYMFDTLITVAVRIAIKANMLVRHILVVILVIMHAHSVQPETVGATSHGRARVPR